MINIIQVFLFILHTAIVFSFTTEFNSANDIHHLFAPSIYKLLGVKYPEKHFIFTFYLKLYLKLNP